MTAPIPAFEEARLATLRSLKLLDTLPEAEYDDLVEAACAVMDVPVTLVSMVDHDRQWFKAKRGVDFCETSRDVAFCAHAILQSEPLVVPDATQDPRFKDNPLVTGEFGLRFYVGLPIVVDGQPIGTLCCKDTRPRTPTDRQISALAALARQVSALLRARRRAEAYAESERRFEAFLDNAPGVSFLKDEHGRMRFVNRRFEAMFGRAAETVLGLTDHEWLPQDFSDACALDDASVRASGESFVFEEKVPVSEGVSRVWRTSKFPVKVDGATWVGGIVEDVTELRAAEAKVREQNEELTLRGEELRRALRDAEAASATAQSAALRFEQLFAGLPVACFTFDAQETIHEWNAAAEELWGIPAHSALLSCVYHTAPCEESRAAGRETVRRTLAGESIYGEERRVIRADGSMRWMLSNTFPLRNAQGEIVGGMSAQIDVTERKAAEEAVRESEERLRTVVESLHEGLVVEDAEKGIVLHNRSAERIMGLTGSQLRGRAPRDPRWQTVRKDGSPFPGSEQPISLALATGQVQPTTIIGIQRPDEAVRWVSVNASPVAPMSGGPPTASVASFLDVTERLEQERSIEEQILQISHYSSELESQKAELEIANARLENLATTDGLTGLKNHRFFQDFLRRKMEQCQGTGLALSVALLDVDRFKAYNDDFGHQAGDAVLQLVARVLEDSIRSEDLVARYGGEEFVIVMPDLDVADACALTERIRRRLATTPFDLREVTASVGVSSYGSDLPDAPALIRAADEALYASKAAGRNRVTHWRGMLRTAA